MESTRDTFYRIYRCREGSGSVNEILKQLDGHPLSITLLATVTHQNRWGAERLVKEWNGRQAGLLQTEYKMSLASTIELSLTSPMFKQLGPDARDLLGVIAFYPQGVNEDNISFRNNGFIAMLASLRDHLSPKDPVLSPLLCVTKHSRFTRSSAAIDPNGLGFRGTQWISSEDVNVEHMLDVSTVIDMDSADIWDSCADFMRHLYWHKPRRTVVGPKVEDLPDGRPSKPWCLFWLSYLFEVIGNHAEKKTAP